MSYNYVNRYYGLTVEPGQRVFHDEIKQYGNVARRRDDPHYVYVRFDGKRDASPCHPLALKFFPISEEGAVS
jgi:hypothetical protein